MTKMLLILTTVAVAVASAASKTYRLSITSPAWIGTNELKPGEYKLEIEGAMLCSATGKPPSMYPRRSKQAVRSPAPQPVTIDNQGNKPVLREIELGGTSTKVVFTADTNPQ